MLRLVEFDRIYLEKSLVWLNDVTLQKLIDSHIIVTRDGQERWFNEIIMDSTYMIWGIEWDGVPIGACGIKHIDYIKNEGEYWGYIGEKQYRGGKGHLILKLIYQKAQELGLTILNLKVLKNNLRAISLYQKEEFIIERETDNGLVMYKKL